MINNFSRTKATDFLLYGGTTGTDNSWMSCEMGNHFSGPDASGSPLSRSYLPPTGGSSSVDDLISEMEVSIFPSWVWASHFLQLYPVAQEYILNPFPYLIMYLLELWKICCCSQRTQALPQDPQLADQNPTWYRPVQHKAKEQRKEKWFPLAWVLSVLVWKRLGGTLLHHLFHLFACLLFWDRVSL